ncbi:non-ribosomal peptide synthetase, partial [Aquimarina aquimarini]
MFRRQSTFSPDTIAISCGDVSMTYEELEHRSTQLSHYLHKEGVRPGMKIPICMDRSIDMIIGVLGILKTGSCYVPIDPDYPSDRISFMLSDTDAGYILTDSSLFSLFRAYEGIIVYDLNSLIGQLADVDFSEAPPLEPVTADTAAYIIYTSGSTGVPKGVVVAHRSIVRLSYMDHLPIDSDTRTLQVSSISFDAATFELWSPLLHGGSVVLYPERHLDLQKVNSIISTHNVNTVWFTSALFDQWVDSDGVEELPLRYVLSGGDVLKPSSVSKLYSRSASVTILNGYGPTENTTFTCCYRIPRDFSNRVSIPIGSPIIGTQVYVLDREMQLCPVGVPGELYTSGEGIALGYLNRPDFTKERFVSNPYGSVDSKLYKTGDVVRWLSTGDLEFIGRNDNQVKIRGFRIELEEIEQQLDQLPQINKSTVIVKETPQKDKFLVAYVIPNDDYEESVVKHQLKTSLPGYMLPQFIEPVAEFPITTNGKIDKDKLSRLSNFELKSTVFVPATSQTEKELVTLWKDLLGKEKISTTHSFFELGGHSLLVMRLTTKIRSQMNIDIDISTVFENPTIKELAAIIDQKESTELIPILQHEYVEDIPLSFSQERLWFLDTLSGTSNYHIPIALKIKGNIDTSLLKKTLKTIIQRHESLRTVFYQKDGKGYQKVLPVEGFTIQEEKLQREIQPKELLSIIDKSVKKPFDLSKDYMVRANLFFISEEETILVITMHHIASDGWSIPIFISEIETIYTSYVENTKNLLEPISVQYSDYSIWQRTQLSEELLNKKLDFWKKNLDNITPLVLPTDYARPSVQSTKGAVLEFEIDQEDTKKIHELSLKQHTTVFMTLLSVFKVVLYRYTGQNDICIGTPVANRGQQEITNLIGFFVNTLAIRTLVEEDSSFTTLLQQIKENTLQAYDHQEVPFESVVDAVTNQRDQSRSPIFQVLFSIQNNEQVTDITLGDTSIESITLPHDTATFDLSCNITERDHKLYVEFEYCTALFKKSTIERLEQHFKNAISCLTLNPETRIQEVALLGIQERQRLLIDFNDNHIQYAQEETILDMFTQQLIANPDHIALKLGDVVYSYDSLDKKSNQLAHYLQASGVEREEYIPICLERSIDMVIGVLGILKAGAVFIPIDPSYPKKRIEFILKDTNARKIISRSAYRDRFSSISTITPIFQEEIQNELQVQRTDTPQIPISPEQRAYVIYTSGTTGKAKGVVCNHKGLYSSMRARNDYYKGYQKALLTLSFSFDASYAVVFGTLLSGGTLVLVKEEEIYDISRIANIFNDNEIDTVICGSQYYNLILSVDTINLDTLKTVILGGDHLPQKSIQKHFEKTRASLYNEYGPTEATIWASVSKISADSKVTIGKPIANTHIHILDDQLELVPIGVVGELCIAGRQLAVGYLNREELTKEKFVNNPFTHHNERLYKTGDLARWLPDGTIEFIGRKDDQVKIRGYRIELAEITYQLDELTSIHQSIVIAKTDKQGTKHIVAYIVTDNTLDTSWIQDQLKDKLPDYMIPKIYVFIDAIPLTYNGKVDKKKLPEPDFSLENTYRAPTTITEQQLVAIWKELLEKEKIGVLDNFFELGGDSIKAIQLVSKAKERNIFFKVKDVFTYQNISAIASNLVKAQDILTEQGKLIGESGLLPVQKMFFETRYTYYNHYNQSMLLSLDKAITYDKLKKVITILIDKHDALRFQYQDIHTANPIQRYITKATSLKRELVANETEITKICESYQQSLSVTEGQIASFVLLETPSDFKKNRLFMAVHHLAIDGVSWRIIFEDLHKLLVKDTVLFIDTKTTSYRQWHKKLTMLAQSVYIHSQRFYWQDILQNYTPLLPENKSEEITTYGNTYHHSNSLSVEATESILSKIHHIYATEINDVLLSALAIVVSNWTNKEKNVIGLEGHGREEIFKNVDVSQTVGWFTSFYPVCLSKQNTIAETIIHTKDFLRSIPDKGIGFGVLKYLSDNEDIQKSLATNFDDITFNYLGTFDNSMSDDMYFDFAKESKGNDINPANHNPHQLAINCVVVDKQLVVNWSYDSLRYTKETISKLATSYQLELENVIKHCLEQTEKVKTSSDYGLSNFVSAHELSSFIKNDNHPSVIEDIYTLSPLQEGMLFHNLLGDNTEAYVIQFSFDFVKGFDKELFIKSWETLSKTHNILRTAFFVNQFEQPVQVVYKNLALSVTEINYSQLTEEEVTIAVDTFLTEDRKKGFDIEKPPLVRFTLIKLPDNSTKCVITNHHLLWDGWSFSLLMNRFIQIYQTIQEGNLLPVLEKDNYGDLIKDIKNKNQLGLAEFWTVYLQSIEKPAYLPFINTPSDRNKVFANTTDEVLFTKDQTRKIIDFVQKHHITTNTLLQGAWAYLLSQYTSTDSVVFGTTISGRDAQIKNIENKVGLYINTIPVCTTVNKNLLVIDWLKEIQSQHTNAREEYGYVPLSQIESYSDVKEALFDSLLVFENYPVGTSDTADKTNIEINNVVAEEYGNYVVSLSISLQSDHLSIKFTYNNKQLDAYFVELIKGHLQTVLFKMLSDITLKEISYRTATEDNNVLQFNTTKCQYPKDKSIITLFDEWVAKQPNAVAVTHHDQEVNYKELYDKSVQIAQYLINKGVSRQENIAVLMDRGLDMISSILGILRAGAVYVPIHKEYPVERLHYILEDARVNYIVCSDISDVETKVTSTTGLLNVSEAYDIEFDTTITDKATIEDTMYIMYTSGTTGEPKGVAVSHKNVIKLVNEKGSIAIRDNDNVLQWSNFAFDGSIYEIFGTLLNGAHLHLINEEHAADAFALTEIIEQKEISVSFMTTTLFNAVVDTNVYALKNIRKLLFGGEKASTYHVKKAFEALGKGKLINVYGPTETVVFATTYDVNTVPENTTPIGKPLNNTILYVLNKDKEICSIGVPGELYIGGDNVSKGYWKKPSLTEQCFIDNPFNKGETLYKTGDLVKWLPDGSIDFVDRIGGQVKIRGYRIELGEIETVLESLESINKAIAHVVSYDTDKQLVAYIQSDTDIDTSEIISCLKKTLPEYMVPIAFVPVANFPRNINGKIDKKSLPDPRDWMSESKEYVGPETTNQQKMITIWERILHNPKIGIYDDFFEKGGHSLSAIRLVSAVRAAYNVDVGIQTIFEHPKLVDLVAFVQEQEISKVPQIEVCKDKKNIPLSFTQERLWFIDKLSGTVNYHIPIILRVSGAFDQKVFLESTTQILTRHESLRTVFKESEGVAYQEVISADTFTLDKSKVEAQEILETVEQIINQPFDLSRDYMLRVALLQISEKEHVIAIVTHHIASDGWSIPIFIQELEQLYNAGLAREQITLPVLPVQYSDYSIWQHSYLSGGILDTKLSYWKKQLSGVSTLALPLDYPRPQIQQTKGAVYEFEIPTSLTKALHVLTQSEGGTLFMTLLGVYKVLLHKYSGQNDICVGTPVANRGQYEISGLIGYFVNTIALRSFVDQNQVFKSLLSNIRETTLSAFDHQEVSFEKIVDTIVSDRDQSSTPLFQVMFSLQNNDQVTDITLGEAVISSLEIPHSSSKFDITFDVTEVADRLLVTVEYCTALFKEATIARMSNHFMTLAESVTISPELPISQLPMLTSTEKEELICTFNKTESITQYSGTVLDMFAHQVNITPEAIAISHGDKKISYEELDKRSNYLAYHLQNKGVTPETLVPICIPRSIEMIVAILGVLKSGGAYVPIDPTYPKDRITFIINDTEATIVLTTQKHKAQIDIDKTIDVLCIETLKQEYSKKYTPVPVSQKQLAYVIYTSGTTGTPKGVMIEHASLVNLCKWHQEYYAVDHTSKVLMISGEGFDASVWEIFPYITSGAELFPIDDSIRLHSENLYHFTVSNTISHAYLPVVLYHELMNHESVNYNVKYLVGGESLTLQNTIDDRLQVYNNYGPTENTVVATCHTITNQDKGKITIGEPIDNVQVYVLDDQLAIVPIGVVGELYIGGAQVARGYLNKPELTKEKFINNPFSTTQQQERLYKTGDLVRWLPSGKLEFVGRNDNQIKIRGYRVELEEIRYQLLQLEEIKEAIVIANSSISKDTLLVAYLVSHESFDTKEIHEKLKGTLPSYMIPGAYVNLDKIPLTPNGKIDITALPYPEISALQSVDYKAAETTSEKRLVQIYQELLGVEKVGVYDDFFRLGGNSLLVIRLIAQIRTAFKIEVTVQDIFTDATIYHIAKKIENSTATNTLPPLEKSKNKESVPLSFSQERLWFLHKLSGSQNYHIPMVFRVRQELHKEALAIALKKIIERHESLRTVFAEQNGEAMQAIIPSEDFELHDIAQTPINEQRIEEYLNPFITQPFDISQEYSLRAGILPIEDDSTILVLVMHHIASDGWSVPIFANELTVLYKAAIDNAAVSLPTLPVQYSDYSIWQRSYLSGEVLEKKLLYWKKHLEGVSPLELPTDFIRPPVQQLEGKMYEFSLENSVTNTLKDIATSQESTLFMVLLSLYKIVLFKYSGQEDICIGTPVANRGQEEVSGLIGYFVNTLALRTQVKNKETFVELLKKVKNHLLEAYEHQDVPFEKVVDTVVKERDQSRTPLFQVLLSLENTTKGSYQNESSFIEPVSFPHTTSKFDISMNISESEDGLSIGIEYCTALFKESTIARMASHFKALVASVLSDIDMPISKLSMLSDAESHQLLDVFNDTNLPYDKQSTIVSMFRRQSTFSPDTIAISCGD